LQLFLRATAVPAGTADARISYGDSVRLSVRPSVTTPWRTKPRWDRDSGSSPYDSIESLVSNDVILVPRCEEMPLERGHQRRVPPSPLEIVILPLLAHLAWKRLQIDTDLLRIITSTADELSGGTNIDDLEPKKIWVLSDFFCYFRLRRTLEWIFAEIYGRQTKTTCVRN